jgi:membrane fusion protein (multidrug efflux system)
MSQTAIERISQEGGLVQAPGSVPEASIQERQRRAVEQAAIEARQLALRRRARRRRLACGLFALALAAGGIGGGRYWQWASVHPSTDDAFVDGHIIPIGPRIPGTVLRVCVSDNQAVRKGDLLVELDPKEYEVRAAQAQAALDVALARLREANSNVEMIQVTAAAAVTQAKAGVEVGKATVASARGTLESAQADVSAAEAEYGRAVANLDRYSQLDSRSISAKELDAVTASARMADAQLRAARKKAVASAAQVAEAEARVLQAQGALDAANAAPQQIAMSKFQAQHAAGEVEHARALLDQAKLDLEYTRVLAPADGRVTRRAVEPGACVRFGEPLMTLVGPEIWVVANFKETQIRPMRPGQKVDLRIDAYADRIFHGHVDSIQSGTGAAVGPRASDNGTGDYVKVVQRVPVRIDLDETPDPAHPLSPGMSAIPTVETGPTRPLTALLWK